MSTDVQQRSARIVHPVTGEVIDLTELDDLTLGALLSGHYELERMARINIRVIQREIEDRGRERGYNDGVRRVYGKWDRVHRAVWEQVREEGV